MLKKRTLGLLVVSVLVSGWLLLGLVHASDVVPVIDESSPASVVIRTYCYNTLGECERQQARATCQASGCYENDDKEWCYDCCFGLEEPEPLQFSPEHLGASPITDLQALDYR